MNKTILILTLACQSALAADTFRVVEVHQCATDWSAVVSVNGAQPQAITFALGKRPTDATIIAKAAAILAAQRAAEAAEAALKAVDPTEKWTVQKTVAGKVVTTTFPVGVRPTDSDMVKAVTAAATVQEITK
jgi:hypothetical protein